MSQSSVLVANFGVMELSEYELERGYIPSPRKEMYMEYKLQCNSTGKLETTRKENN